MIPGVEQRQCGHKHIHISEENACIEARRLHKLKKAHFVAYACPHCHGWHVGTDRSRQAAIRREARNQRAA